MSNTPLLRLLKLRAGTGQQGETEPFLTCHYRFFQAAQESKLDET